MVLLEAKKLSKSFGGVKAADNVDFEVGTGEIVGLVGPNGAGKTTIFNLVTGFIPSDSGITKYKGETISRLRPDQIAKRGIGRTFQLTLVFRGQTVFQSLLAGHVITERSGFWQALFDTKSYRQEQELALRKARDILEFLELTEWSDTLASALPYGMQGLLAIGQVLMMSPQIMLLDEPLTGLNEEEISHRLDRLRRLREQGTSIFIIEHHMRAIMAFCDRLIVMNYGRIIAEGTPLEIGNNPTVIEAYLGAK